MNKEENTTEPKNDFSRPLITQYQDYMKEYGKDISDLQACSDLNKLADLFLIFAENENHGNVKE